VFDYRYHALSLAAVLLALAVGVVIGVAIGDSNLVSSAKSGIVHDLSSEVSGAHHQADQLRTQLSSEEAFASDLYPIAVHGLLSGRRIGLVFLGASSNTVNGLARNAVTQAGGDLVTVAAVREPLDLPGLARGAAGTRYAALGAAVSRLGTQLVERFGALAGRQLVSGGLVSRELLGRERGHLLSAFDGQLGRLEGVVLMRADPTGMIGEQLQSVGAFQSGLIRGVAAAGVPIVGVELSSTQPSQVPWYGAQNISSVVRFRQKVKESFKQREGIDLTYVPIIVKAVVEGLKAVPVLNASWTDQGVLLHKDINVGVAVSVDDGLIVPVIHQADRMSIAGLAKVIDDLAKRARAGKLGIPDVQGATFTVNNPGTFGTILSYSIIAPPQAGILAMDAIVKRPVVIEGDAIAVRSMMNLCLSFDHRVLDGVSAARFLQGVRRWLEGFSEQVPLY